MTKDELFTLIVGTLIATTFYLALHKSEIIQKRSYEAPWMTIERIKQ